MGQQYTVIVENDITQWEDDTGKRYHFPKRYMKFLTAGTPLIHYKGGAKKLAATKGRLSPDPHYFACSIAGPSVSDASSDKGDRFLEITEFRLFSKAVPHRIDGATIEQIPPSRAGNFWRDGVRPTNFAVYQRVLEQAGLHVEIERESGDKSPAQNSDEATTTFVEGQQQLVLSTRYERRPELRAKAIALHGTQCFACDEDMGHRYGPEIAGFVHIHHLQPLSQLAGPTVIDPKVDLVPLCPSCHAVAHYGNKLRSVDEVRAMLKLPPRSRS